MYWLYKILRKRYATPIHGPNLYKYDPYLPLWAALRAWSIQGKEAQWHKEAQESVRLAMPLLARALDRAEKKYD